MFMEEELKTTEDELQENESSVKYDIATYPSDFTLSGINEMWKSGDITIPDFQREFVWTLSQSSLLIESFLLGLPVPPVFFYIDDENKNLVIDGQQRILSTAFYFDGYFGFENVHGKKQVFRLKSLSKDSPYANKTFDELSESDKRKLKGTVLRAINIRQLSPKDSHSSVYHIFERLNTGGTALKPQEIRNCVYRGNIVTQLRELNQDPNWRLIIGRKNIDKHQKDVELILRIFGLRYYLNKYEAPMKGFLNTVMELNRKAESSEFETFQKEFRVTSKQIVNFLGERPFSIKGPLNSAILDSVYFSFLKEGKVSKDIKKRFEKLVKSESFIDLTGSRTTNTAVVKDRIALAENILFS